MSTNVPTRLLTPKQTSELLGGTALSTLAVWRSSRRYDLPYVKVGRSVRYREEDVLSFIARRTQHPAPSAT